MGIEQIAIYAVVTGLACLLLIAGLERRWSLERAAKKPLPIEWSNIRALEQDIKDIHDFIGQWVPIIEGRAHTVEKHLDGGLNPLTMTPIKHVHLWVDVSGGPNLQVLACRCGEEREIAL